MPGAAATSPVSGFVGAAVGLVKLLIEGGVFGFDATLPVFVCGDFDLLIGGEAGSGFRVVAGLVPGLIAGHFLLLPGNSAELGNWRKNLNNHQPGKIERPSNRNRRINLRLHPVKHQPATRTGNDAVTAASRPILRQRLNRVKAVFAALSERRFAENTAKAARNTAFLAGMSNGTPFAKCSLQCLGYSSSPRPSPDGTETAGRGWSRNMLRHEPGKAPPTFRSAVSDLVSIHTRYHGRLPGRCIRIYTRPGDKMHQSVAVFLV